MNGPCHRSKTSQDAWHERASWLPVIWLARYSPELHRKEREWRYLKRDARGHLARTLREFADGILAGLRRLGGTRIDVVDQVPDWFLDGHRRPPTGRPPGRGKVSRLFHRHADGPGRTRRPGEGPRGRPRGATSAAGGGYSAGLQ